MQHAWTCACCGEQYSTLPLDFAADAPDYWYGLSAEERTSGVLTADLCTIAGEYHFIRGCLELPIHGRSERLVFGVWVSFSEASMRRAAELWDAEVIEDEPPRFGWLSTNVRPYPRSLELKAAVHFRAGGLRPLVELEPSDHPLAREQREGISMNRVQEIVATLMHRH
ncbi:DUF2199 domain-containing protein [Methylobacterium nodulans]|uniref:DUF2199 domain-containing protein n=1 Tax=Methylobacterium nodulans (strain LMG 21967 / CNCM I-2342 / ORS 2060) TaxID=460265 RepID=B8IGP5_METNO|nr:DUF2199 domain-containing protein [Methylobacterium nodulans]ACL55945.1 conserved hypothetical protein [Methylobacterium nodulans ORS 2060]